MISAEKIAAAPRIKLEPINLLMISSCVYHYVNCQNISKEQHITTH